MSRIGTTDAPATSGVLPLLFAVFLIGMTGCSAPESQRQQLMREKYPSYPEDVRKAIDSGTLLKGMSQEQVLLALGPTPCTNSRTIKGKIYDSWAYKLDAASGKLTPPVRCHEGRQAVVFENGRVIEWDAK